MPTLIRCSCGASFYQEALEKNNHRCPGCGIEKDRRRWTFHYVGPLPGEEEGERVDALIDAKQKEVGEYERDDR